MGYDLPVGLIYAVHGFLGQGSDWDQVKTFSKDSFTWETPSLFSQGAYAELSLAKLNQFKGRKIFLGYSLGGRIGLSLLKNDPQLFDHYVFVSVNPGFNDTDKDSRQERLIRDADWANKISQENWETFLKEWNAQPVFDGYSHEPVRNIKDYDLNLLKDGLLKWSLGNQPDYTELIENHKSRISWLVGSKDSKFVSIAEELKNKMVIDSYIKIESGHRIPFDSPKKLAEIINTVAEKN